MSANDDEDWARILAGGDADGADPKVRRRAQALRDEMTRRMQAIPLEESEDAWMEKLRARIGETAQADAPAPRPGFLARMAAWIESFSMPRLALAAVLVLAVGVGVRMVMQDSPQNLPDVVYRGQPVGTRIYLEVDDPARQQAAFVQALTAAGIAARAMPGQDAKGALIVQASIPAPVDEKVAQVLAQHGLQDFPGGDLDIGFKTRP